MKPVPGGGWKISSPRRSGQGHGDIVSALVLGVHAANLASQGGAIAPPVRQLDPTNAPIGFAEIGGLNVNGRSGSSVRNFLDSVGAADWAKPF